MLEIRPDPKANPQPVLEQEKINDVDARLKAASARKLAKNILSAKQSEKGYETPSFGLLKAETLVSQVFKKRKELIETEEHRYPAVNSIIHLFQRFRNFFMTDMKFKTDLQLLALARKSIHVRVKIDERTFEGKEIRKGYEEPVAGAPGTIIGKSTDEVQATPIPKPGCEYERFHPEDPMQAFVKDRKAARKKMEPPKIKKDKISFDRVINRRIGAVIKEVGNILNLERLEFDKTQKGFLEDCISLALDECISSGKKMDIGIFEEILLDKLDKGNKKEDEFTPEEWYRDGLRMKEHMPFEEFNQLNLGERSGFWEKGEVRKITWFVFPDNSGNERYDLQASLNVARHVIKALCADPEFTASLQAEFLKWTERP